MSRGEILHMNEQFRNGLKNMGPLIPEWAVEAFTIARIQEQMIAAFMQKMDAVNPDNIKMYQQGVQKVTMFNMLCQLQTLRGLLDIAEVPNELREQKLPLLVGAIIGCGFQRASEIIAQDPMFATALLLPESRIVLPN